MNQIFENNSIICSFCQICFNKNFQKRRRDAICYYNSRGALFTQVISKICLVCKAEHFLSYAELNTVRKPLNNILCSEYISFTTETVFEILLLKRFTAELLFNNATFVGFSNAYNYLFGCKIEYIDSKSRVVMNEKRFTETWFYFHYINIYKEIYGSLNNFKMPFISDLDTYLKELKPSLLTHFVKKWTSKTSSLKTVP